MSRRGMSGVLLIVIALVPLAFIIDFALLFVSFPDALKYVGIIDVPIFTVIAVAIVLSRRRQSLSVQMRDPLTTALDKLRERNGGRRAPGINDSNPPSNETEEEEAEVFMEGTDVENHAQQVNEILQRMKAREIDLGAGPIPEVEAREPSGIVESVESTKEQTPAPHMVSKSDVTKQQTATPEKISKSNGKVKNYSLSPDKLMAPAFICRCRHPHRFVCLTCGMTTEQAAKNSKTHWVEWVPEMGSTP